MSVINGAVWPLVQLNIPEGFLNPMEDKKVKTTEEEKRDKVRKMVLPIPDATCLKHEPKKWSDLHPHGCGVAKDVPKILQ